MALNFPDAPFDGQQYQVGNQIYTYNTAKGLWVGAVHLSTASGTSYDDTETQMGVEEVQSAIERIVTNGPGSPGFDEDFTVLGVSQGIYEPGSIILEGEEVLQVVKNMLSKLIPPVYTMPTLSLADNIGSSFEVGTTISPILTPTWTQNDAGLANNYDLNKDTVLLFNNATPVPYTDSGVVILEEVLDYQGFVTYADGPILNDNAGNPYPTGQILAGTVASNVIAISGKRNAFFDVNGSITDIRSLANTKLGPANGTTLTMTSSTTPSNDFVFSYPANLRDRTEVKMVSAGFTFIITAECIAQPTQEVAGVGGVAPTTYKVFKYSPTGDFTSATFTVTI
jgi:hypothetical protein